MSQWAEVDSGVVKIIGIITSMDILNREAIKKTTTTMEGISITPRAITLHPRQAVTVRVAAAVQAEAVVRVAAAVQAVAAVRAVEAVRVVAADRVVVAVVVAAVAVAVAAVVEVDDFAQASSSKEVSRALFIESSFVNQNVGVSPISASHR